MPKTSHTEAAKHHETAAKAHKTAAELILGLITGFIGGKIVNDSGQGVILGFVLGSVGPFVGGYLFTVLGAAPGTGFNLYGMLVAVIGVIVVLVIHHVVARA